MGNPWVLSILIIGVTVIAVVLIFTINEHVTFRLKLNNEWGVERNKRAIGELSESVRVLQERVEALETVITGSETT